MGVCSGETQAADTSPTLSQILVRMRNLLLLATLTLAVSLASAQQNGGLFSGLTSAFNNFFGGQSPNNRPQSQRPRPQFQQQQQQQFQPQQQQQQQFFQPQQQQFQQPQQQQFQPRPASQGSFQQAPAFRPQPAPVRQAAFSSSASSGSSSSNTISGGTAKCAAQAPNHFWQGQSFVVTWKFGCRDFEQHEAREYCQSMGMEPVSLDTPDKQNEFNRLIARTPRGSSGPEALLITLTSWWDGPTQTRGPSDSPTVSTGPTPEAPASPSLTTERPRSSLPAPRPASPSSTTSTPMGSSGTTWPATTRSPPCASRGHNEVIMTCPMGSSIFIQYLYLIIAVVLLKSQIIKQIKTI